MRVLQWFCLAFTVPLTASWYYLMWLLHTGPLAPDVSDGRVFELQNHGATVYVHFWEWLASFGGVMFGTLLFLAIAAMGHRRYGPRFATDLPPPFDAGAPKAALYAANFIATAGLIVFVFVPR